MDHPLAPALGRMPPSPRKRSLHRLPALFTITALLLLTLGQAQAAPIVYSGTLATDDTVQLFTVSLSMAQNVTFQTVSYATGGFVPVLTLFNGAGNFLAVDGGDATCQSGMTASSSTHLCDDAVLSSNLAAGSYTLALTEFPNYSNDTKLSDGFTFAGTGNFTGGFCGSSGGFLETDVAPCAQRTNAYNLGINIQAPTTATPEPSTLAFTALPLFALGLYGWRRS